MSPGKNPEGLEGYPGGPGAYPKGPGSYLRSPGAVPGGERGDYEVNPKSPGPIPKHRNLPPLDIWYDIKKGIHLPLPPPTRLLWSRRQYGSMPPMYFKDREQRPNEYREDIPTGRDDRYLTPEQRSQESPDYNNNMDPEFLQSLQSNSFDKPRIAFDENVNEANIPIGNARIPGPGSEADFPNGYRPNYRDNSRGSPGFYSMPQSYSGGYPEAKKNPFTKSLPKRTSYKKPPQLPPKKQAAEGYPDDFKNALRTGGPRFQSGPGSETDFPQGFHPKLGGGNMEMGVPVSNGLRRPPRIMSEFQGMGQEGPPPGWHSEGRAGWKPDKTWGSSRFIPPGEPAYQPPEEVIQAEQSRFTKPFSMPGIRQEKNKPALRGGTGDKAITFQGQNPSAADVDQGQAGFKPRLRNLVSNSCIMDVYV